MTDVKNNFMRLKSAVIQDIRDDEEMKSAFDEFEKLIEQDVTFANILFVEK